MPVYKVANVRGISGAVPEQHYANRLYCDLNGCSYSIKSCRFTMRWVGCGGGGGVSYDVFKLLQRRFVKSPADTPVTDVVLRWFGHATPMRR